MIRRPSRLVSRLAPLVACALLAVGWENGCVPRDTDFRSKPVLVADAAHLRSSLVTADPEVPLANGQNVLWCSTFQLAWNEVRALAGGQVRFEPPENPLVAALNHSAVDAGDLDPASYIAVAGYVRDGIYQRIDRMWEQKFRHAPKRTLAPDPLLTARPQDIVAYSYLFKQLDFPRPFERPGSPLSFNGSHVASFGMDEHSSGHAEMAKGIKILDYQGPDDFIIELTAKSPADHLLLAKIAPAASLAATIASVTHRGARAKATAALSWDILSVPKMNFDITRQYSELLGRRLIATAPGMPDDAEMLAAEQNIRFLMDEKGVQLRSESNMSFGCSVAVNPEPVHRLVFDKPFLLLLTRDGGNFPYLAIWVANAELLERSDQ